ncbi:AAA family ATPase, partial [Xanthomonas phaseoli]
MRLFHHDRQFVMLYGPPAVGKLTVGKALANRLSACLFHNHLTYDLAIELLGADSGFDARRQFACKLRLHALALLFKSDSRTIITTFCYGGAEDDWYIDALKTLCADHLMTPRFVQLTAQRSQLLDRVENVDRRAFGKVNSSSQLSAILQECAYTLAIPADHHLCLDTSMLLPDDTALAIVTSYQQVSTLMGDKTDKNTIAWLAQPEEHDYPAAQSYLNLLYDDAHCTKLVRKMHAAPMSAFKAKDILRASGLSPLG